MAETPEEESKRKSPYPEPEKPPIVIDPASGSQPIVPNQDTSHMEVHQHAHHGSQRGWKSYFWEFLMLFLAVFCGFLAEYRLEHVIEHQREKKLMLTLTDDLTADKATLQKYLQWRTQTNSDFDSLLLLLSVPEPEKNAYLVYKLANRSALRFGLPDINAGTISQLTYSGGLRLVRSRVVSDAINKHYLGLNRMKSIFETELQLRLNLVKTRAEILDAKLLLNPNPEPSAYSFISNEPTRINQLMHDILTARVINKTMMTNLDSFSISTGKLHELIDQEYHFK